MAIPTDIRDPVKELCRLAASDSSQHARIQELYERELDALVRETDILAEREDISAVAEQSIYSTATRATRVLATFHNRTQLMRSSSNSLDLNSYWQSDPSGDPEEYTLDRIPPGLDVLGTITPQQLAVHPAPQTTATGEAGFIVLEVARPSNDDPRPLYLKPYLTFRTAAAFNAGNTDDRDQASARFWAEVASLWLQVISAKVP